MNYRLKLRKCTSRYSIAANVNPASTDSSLLSINSRFIYSFKPNMFIGVESIPLFDA